MSQQGLADRLNQLGARVDRSVVAKVESGKRAVSLEDAFRFALALDVAPVHLLVPIDSDEPIHLAPNRGIAARGTELDSRLHAALSGPPRLLHVGPGEGVQGR